jgi:TolB-like protein
MRSTLISILFLIMCFTGAAASEEKSGNSDTIKRSILILPFYNVREIRKYDYLSDTIVDTLETDLRNLDRFIVKSPDSTEQLLAEFKVTRSDLLLKKDASRIARKYKCDVYVIGKYVIEEKKIMLFIETVDIFSDEVIASTYTEGKIGVDLFRVITEGVNQVTAKMEEQLQVVSKTYFEEMIRVQRRKLFQLDPEIWTWRRKLGTGMTIGGSISTGIFLPVLLIDIFTIYPLLISNSNNGVPVDSDQFARDYTLFNILLFTSVISMGLGLVALIPGIALIAWKNKHENLTLSVSFGYHLTCSVSLSIGCFHKRL